MVNVWIVHGNWTGTGKHYVHVKKGKRLTTRQFSKMEQAKTYAVNKAKAEKLKTYEVENSSGRWVDRPVNRVVKKRVVRRSSPYSFRW